ncbi:MAG: ABC transporter ATP-binding protein [Ferruginibacter sp.]|nr:ABC transporter ATP-binding protein [Ferruginibacter sp.]
MEPVVEIENLSIQFPKDNEIGGHTKISTVHNAVSEITFKIFQGEILAIVGESGSGKTLSALSLLSLLPPFAMVDGTISLFNKNKKQLSEKLSSLFMPLRGKEIAMIFQDPMTSLNPVITCGNQVIEALLKHQQISNSKAKEKTIELFKEVELQDASAILDRYPHQLSGGQQQRVMIAMALCNRPKLLIADEPTTALDISIQAGILTLLQSLCIKYNMAILLISHDLHLVKKIANRIIVMQHGKIVEEGTVSKIFYNPEQKYTRQLLQCDVHGKQKNVSIPETTDTDKTKTFSYLPPGEVLFDIKDLVIAHKKRERILFKKTIVTNTIDNIAFQIREHEFIGLAGESGSGKSTLAKAILNILAPTSGKIKYKGTDISTLTGKALITYRKEIQMVFQNPFGALNPRLTIGETLAEPLIYHRMFSSKKEVLNKVNQLLADVHLPSDSKYRYPHQFSGGQQQRICIARALALDPQFIIFDESVSALDLSIQTQILNLISSLREKRGFGALFISHDIDVVYYLCDRILIMKNGKIVEDGNAEQVYHHPVNEYTKTLIGAFKQQTTTL